MVFLLRKSLLIEHGITARSLEGSGRVVVICHVGKERKHGGIHTAVVKGLLAGQTKGVLAVSADDVIQHLLIKLTTQPGTGHPKGCATHQPAKDGPS
jgi:hypothetical protein